MKTRSSSPYLRRIIFRRQLIVSKHVERFFISPKKKLNGLTRWTCDDGSSTKRGSMGYARRFSDTRMPAGMQYVSQMGRHVPHVFETPDQCEFPWSILVCYTVRGCKTLDPSYRPSSDGHGSSPRWCTLKCFSKHFFHIIIYSLSLDFFSSSFAR